MCAKDDFVRRKGLLLISTQTWEVLFQIHNRRLAEELATAESVTAKDSNHVDTFGLDFAFLFANILSLIAFIISYCLFADKLNIQQSLLDRVTVVLIIISVDKTQLSLILGDRLTPSTLLARFIPTTKIRNPLLKTLENAAKSGILLVCADRRIRQCYLTIYAILRCLNKGHNDFVHLVDCFRWKHYNFNIHISLATDTLHLLLKGLVIKMLDFMQDMLDDIYPSSRKTWDNSTILVTQESGKQKAIIQQLIAVVSLLFVSKAPFALHFIRAVCDLVTLAQYKSHDEDILAYIQGALERINHALTHIIQDIRMYGALDSICTRANSEAHHITIVKQFYSITNKKEVTRPLPFRRLRWSILGIQPYSTKLPLSEVAVNIAISNFIHAAAVFQSSSKRHNNSKHCDEEVLYLILIIIDYTCYDKDRKYMAYIGAFSKVLLFNNNRQIDNTTRMLSILQAFKFYDLSMIIRLVHLVPRDLPNLTTYTTMSYYVNNYIN
ncbi:hypothetical protein HBI46_013870 [Parastagonospora nodorum]|nr:hypothetical protein HBI46_013870 [Parastagonospora nodorum]